MKGLFLSGLLALTVSVVSAPLVLALLRRGSVLDHVSERSSHSRPTPRGGGVAPALGALVALTFAPTLDARARLVLASVAAAFGLIGLVEDLVGIPAVHRLVLQVALALVAAPLLLHRSVDSVIAASAAAAMVAMWMVAYVNAFNFMDGIDGISVSQATAAGIAWMLIGTAARAPELAAGGAIVAGATLGFAPYNLPRARMFLGDVGSYFLGAWLAATAVLAIAAGVPPEAVLAPLALYGADTGVTLLRRIRAGQVWHSPHRQHVYQRLGDLSLTHIQISALVGAFIVICGALGAVSLGRSLVARVLADAALVAVVVAYLYAPRWLGRRRASVVMA